MPTHDGLRSDNGYGVKNARTATIQPDEEGTAGPMQMHPAWRALLQDIELMPKDQDFSFKLPAGLEAVAQHADEKKGNCHHRPRSCSDWSGPLPRRMSFSEATAVPDAHRPQACFEDGGKRSVIVANETVRRAVPGKRLGDLPRKPLGRRVSGHRGLQELPSAVAKNKKCVELFKGNRRDHKQIN